MPAGKEPKGTSAAGKEPRSASLVHEDRHLRFRFGRLDHDKWALSGIAKDHHKRLLRRLAYFEELTVEQARSNRILADYDMADCPNRQAQQRLAEQYDGQDALCRLTVEPGGALRLLGIRDLHEFHIVWWDSTHDIWPEGKIRR